MKRSKWIAAAIVFLLLGYEAVRQAGKSHSPLRSPSTATIRNNGSPNSDSSHSLSAEAEQWFHDATDQVGIDFVQRVGPFGTHFMPEINGSGGALFDVDNDNDLDLFLVNFGKSPKVSANIPGDWNLSHRLYRQESDGLFSDQTQTMGLSQTRLPDGTPLGIGCAIGDVNNDGFSDVYVTNYGKDQLFLNRSGKALEDQTDASGLGCELWGTAAAFFDYDRDGWLDLIVVNYCEDKKYGHSVGCGFSDGTISYCGPHKFQPTVDRLYRNDGADSMRDGVPHFTDVTSSSGLDKQSTYGLGLAIADFDGNLYPDIFVANDMRENRLWMNQGDGTFLEEAGLRGVAVNGEGMMQGCMGVACADWDHDADFDLIVTNLVTEGATLYRNNGQGVFEDVSQGTDLWKWSKKHTGWGVAWIDLDLNGELDLPMVNGFVVPNGSMFPPHGEDQFQDKPIEVLHQESFISRYYDKNQLLVLDGKGRFQDQTRNAGAFLQFDGSNRSLIHGDVDADGDLDLVTTSVAGRARLHRNDMPRKGTWLKVSCRLPGSGREALGAVVRVISAKQKWTGQVAPSTSYLASNEATVHFGLGDVKQVERIEVTWPNGSHEMFPGTTTGQTIVLVQGTGRDRLGSPE